MTNAQSKHQVKLDYTPLFKLLNDKRGIRTLNLTPADATALRACTNGGMGHFTRESDRGITEDTIVVAGFCEL